jgi:hypothetical protein
MKKVLYIAVVLIALLSSCKLGYKDRIIGEWEQVSYFEQDTIIIRWRFYAGDLLKIWMVNKQKGDEIVHAPQGGKDTVVYTYNIESSTFNIFTAYDTVARFPELQDPRGEYWVDILNKSEFKLTKQKTIEELDAYRRIELLRR